MTMCEPPLTGGDPSRDPQSTLWPEGFLVSPSVLPATVSVRMMPGGSGRSSMQSFAHYDLGTSSWRTSQGCLTGDLATYSGTWPRAGTTRNGIAYPRQPSVPRINATAYSRWPTPQASDKKRSLLRVESLARAFWRKRLRTGAAILGEALAAEFGYYLTPAFSE